MPTGTDTAFSGRFSPMTIAGMVGNASTLPNYVPTTSPINTGLLSDIGRATVWGPDQFNNNFYARFLKSPLKRGDSTMMMRSGEVTSRAYNPNAPDTDLFNGQKPVFLSDVAKKNFDRQIAVEIHEDLLKQFCQTEEMIGDLASSIMATSQACYLDDMWVASKAFFSGSERSMPAASEHVLTNDVDDAGFADEMNELLWNIIQNQFGYKSNKYNALQANTFSTNVHIGLKKSCEYPAFKKLYSATFHPDFLKVSQTIDYVDDYATPAGKPASSGELLGIVVDDRAWQITPMPDAITTEAFRNPARRSTSYFTHYSAAFQVAPFFNIAFIYAPSS